MHGNSLNIASFCKSLSVLVLAVLSVGVSPAKGQVFDTVINLPPSPDIGDDGSVGEQFGGVTTQLNLAEGGTIGSDFTAWSGSEVNISGGTVGDDFRVWSDAVVNISGGSIGDDFNTRQSEVNISGGTVGSSSSIGYQSVVSVSGGTIGSGFRVSTEAEVELIGGEFELNGEAFSGSAISLNELDVFTGTLADGSTFVFTQIGLLGRSDRFSDVQLTPVALPPLDLSPIVVSTANPNRPSGLRSGQMLTLRDGGELEDNFEAVDATLNIEGGSLGRYAGVSSSEVNVTGGSVGDGFNVYAGSEINISAGSIGRDCYVFPGSALSIEGGSVGNVLSAYRSEVNISGGTVGNFNALNDSVVNVSGGAVARGSDAWPGSEVNITGGAVDSDFDARDGSVVNISGGTVGFGFNAFGAVNITGGTVGRFFDAFPGSVVNISGGAVGSINALDDSEVNFFGSDFLLDGEPLVDLLLGQAFTIDDRDVTLSGKFADGSEFSFDLDLSFVNLDRFNAGATVTVTLVAPFMLGDVNRDGAVDFLDIGPFISLLSAGTFQEEADIDGSDVVDFLDIGPFITLLSS